MESFSQLEVVPEVTGKNAAEEKQESEKESEVFRG